MKARKHQRAHVADGGRVASVGDIINAVRLKTYLDELAGFMDAKGFDALASRGAFGCLPDGFCSVVYGAQVVVDEKVRQLLKGVITNDGKSSTKDKSKKSGV